VNEHDGVTLRILTYLTCFSLAFFPVLWLVGQEGSASASLTLEVALSAVADVLAKVAFAVTLIVRLEVDGTTYRSQGGKMGSVAAGRVVDSTYV
jgi:bacteriorhodopsin